MSDLFDLSNFDKYKEDNCREVKKAEGGLPIALWESYSSFANSNGGVIILGVGERQDGILLDLRMRINLRETFGTQFMILRR